MIITHRYKTFMWIIYLGYLQKNAFTYGIQMYFWKFINNTKTVHVIWTIHYPYSAFRKPTRLKWCTVPANQKTTLDQDTFNIHVSKLSLTTVFFFYYLAPRLSFSSLLYWKCYRKSLRLETLQYSDN